MHTPGTYHFVESDRRGERVWDVVICASCLAEHMRVPLLRGEARTVTDYTGEPRPCSWCDDSENAPEFKFGPVLALMLLLLVPSMAQAQTKPIIIGNLADIVSTEVVIAVADGRLKEGNPITGHTTAQRVAVKAAGTAVQVWAVRKLSKRHPKAAKVTGYVIGAALSGVAAWNLSRLQAVQR